MRCYSEIAPPPCSWIFSQVSIHNNAKPLRMSKVRCYCLQAQGAVKRA